MSSSVLGNLLERFPYIFSIFVPLARADLSAISVLIPGTLLNQLIFPKMDTTLFDQGPCCM